jgi:hypothetical protein
VANHKRITGRRRDLHGVRDAGALRAVFLEGPGIGSLAGIERMTAVEAVYLERLPSPDLSLLSGLHRLRVLSVENVTGDVAWRALERLHGVRTLRLEVADAAAAAAVAALDFGALAALEMLTLVTSAPTPLDVAWAPRLERLVRILVQGFFVPVGREQPLCDAPALRHIDITTLTMEQYRRLSACRPDAAVLYPASDEEQSRAALGVVLEPERGVTDRFSVGFDLAEMWSLETNPEAEALLRRELRARFPELLPRLGFDTESGAVWIDAAASDDLATVRTVVEAIAAARSRGA